MERLKPLKLLTLFILLSLFTGIVSADWKPKTLEEPYGQLDVSNNTSTVKLVNLSDNSNQPVNSTKLENEDDTDLYYKYNGSSSDRTEMEYLGESYYYAEFVSNDTEGKNVTYQLYDDSADGGLINQSSQIISFGNMTVDWVSGVDGRVEPDRSFDIRVNVTDDWNDTFEDQAEVDFYVTNVSWKSDIYGIDNSGDIDGDSNQDHYKNLGIQMDLDYDSDYVFHFNATNSSKVGYNSTFGSYSTVVETQNSLDGTIVNLNTTAGCNNQSFFRECERDADLDTAYNVSGGNVNGVNVTIRIWNSTGNEWVENRSYKMTEQQNYWTTELSVPDINTSKYAKKFQLLYKVSGSEQTLTEGYNITYRTFDTRYVSSSQTDPGSYDVRIEYRKYFTPGLIDRERLKSTINITESEDGDQLTAFNLSEMEKKEDMGYYEKEIDISSDAEPGIYDVEVNTTNLYDENKVDQYQFELNDLNQSFNAEDIDEDITGRANWSFNITVENLLSSDTEIGYNIKGDIENFTTFNNGSNISIPANDDDEVKVEFDIDRVENYTGEIELEDLDSSYNRTVDVELNVPSCWKRNGTLCIENQPDLNLSTDSSEFEYRTMSFRYFGTGETVNVDVEGNISDYAVLDSGSYDFDSYGEETVGVNYTGFPPGYLTGEIELDNSVTVPVELDADYESSGIDLELPSSIDLGVVPEDESVEKEMNAENTGNTQIDLEFSGTSFEVSSDTESLDAGEEENITLDFSSIEAGGSMTVTASSDGSEASYTVTVNAETLKDLTVEAQSLRSEVNSLETQVSDPALQSTVNQLGPRIDEMENEYQSGNYEDSKQLYDEIQGDIQNVRSQLSNQEPGNRSQQPPQNPSTSGSDSGGILLPLAIAVLVLLVVGFMFYSSYIPEEGDPLYGVFGE